MELTRRRIIFLSNFSSEYETYETKSNLPEYKREKNYRHLSNTFYRLANSIILQNRESMSEFKASVNFKVCLKFNLLVPLIYSLY